MEGISWVTPDNFDPDKISVQPASKSPSDTYDRLKIMYEYTPGSQRDLLVTVPRVEEAYITCRGVHKDIFTRGDTRIETNRYGAQLILEGNNDYHVSLYKLFQQVLLQVEKLTNTTTTFPAKDMDNYSIVYTNLIHSNDGKMYSSAYTDSEYIDITECGKCLVRPGILLSALKKSHKETKIRAQISQMYVYKQVTVFPLATQD